jgi:hypothetical protein
MRTTRLLSAMAEEFETLAAESAAREDSDAAHRLGQQVDRAPVEARLIL